VLADTCLIGKGAFTLAGAIRPFDNFFRSDMAGGFLRAICWTVFEMLVRACEIIIKMRYLPLMGVALENIFLAVEFSWADQDLI
jgi:hypothetical protein